MAITIINQPTDYGRCYDTNRLMFKISSTNANLPNFRFYIDIYVGTPDDLPTYEKVATVRKRPLPDGTCFFNPAEIWSNYLTYDLDIDQNAFLYEATKSNGKFFINIMEEYGVPPTVYLESEVASTAITLYNGLQEYIPYDIEYYGGGNNQWVVDNTVENRGKFLTDAFHFQVDNDDWASLYFLAETAKRPTHVRLKIYYINEGVAIMDGGDINYRGYTSNPGDITKQSTLDISAPNPMRGFPPTFGTPTTTTTTTLSGETASPNNPRPPIIAPKPQISSYYTGFTLDYTNEYNNMYIIPTGPKNLERTTLFNLAKANSGWVWYEVELTNGISSGAEVYTQYPISYLRKDKCSRYDPIELFWLNPHGGFDRYTFYKKNYISYDIERTLWEKRFSDEYELGERGKTVYKTKAIQKVELNTDWLTASEAQTLGQLMLSPEVYASYTYKGKVYPIPFTVIDNSFDYKEIKNEKVVAMNLNITPSWNRVSQTS